MSKRIQCFGILCIVVSMALCPFLSVSASLVGSPSTQPYMPVCPAYVSAEVLPFGEDTLCVFVEETNYMTWFFMSMADMSDTYKEFLINNTQFNMYDEYIGFWADDNNDNPDFDRILFYSLEKIVKVKLQKSNQSMVQTTIGTIDSNLEFRFKAINTIEKNPVRIIASRSYFYDGHGLDYYLANGTGWGSESDYLNYLIAQYPTSVSQAVESIGDDTAMIETYYNNLNSTLTQIRNRVSTLESTVEEMYQAMMDYGDIIIEQNDENADAYSEALSNAQAEIESNAHSAAQSAADEVNNAGEDVSDIDTDMDDVNSIVDTLDGWIETLDDFADSIDTSITGVAGALDNASAVVTGFLGACPPVVIALFGFALVFLVVRKIIGR